MLNEWFSNNLSIDKQFEWMNHRVNDEMHKWINEGGNEKTSPNKVQKFIVVWIFYKQIIHWMIEWMIELINLWMNKKINEFGDKLYRYEWMNKKSDLNPNLMNEWRTKRIYETVYSHTNEWKSKMKIKFINLQMKERK